MRIALDLTPLQPPLSGVGQYTDALVRALISLESGHDFRAWSTGLNPLQLAPPLNTMPHKHLGFPTRALYKSWEYLHAPRIDALLGGVDIIHATNYFLPPTKFARRVVSIYDIAFIKHPEWASPKIVGPFSKGIRRFTNEADAIITISEASKKDLTEVIGVDSQKIHIVYPGVEDAFQAPPKEEAQRIILERHGIKPPYLLFVGTLEPRKNIDGLLEAFSEIQGSIPHHLVLVGAEGWNKVPTSDRIQQLRIEDRVIRLGYLKSRHELPAFYSAADAFVFPSHYEGFGIPILEAMRCGCPVISGNNSALPEVGGKAALYFDSHKPSMLAECIKTLISNKGMQARLREMGYAQSQQFTWKRCAQETLAVYGSLC